MIDTQWLTKDNAIKQQTNAREKSQEASGFKSPTVVTAPRFSKEQMVYFIGGKGTIKSCRFESSSWTYTVEMHLDRESNKLRIGSETTVLLEEVKIY